MSSLTLQNEVVKKLMTVAGGVELRDQQGNLIGYFHPVVSPEDVDQFEAPLPDHEVQSRLEEQGGRPLSEILNKLGAQQ